jgi:hypothetical protein
MLRRIMQSGVVCLGRHAGKLSLAGASVLVSARAFATGGSGFTPPTGFEPSVLITEALVNNKNYILGLVAAVAFIKLAKGAYKKITNGAKV